jgi:hypothetical protein
MLMHRSQCCSEVNAAQKSMMLRSQSCFTDSFIQGDCSESLISVSRLSYLRFKHSSITILDANQHTLGSIAISGNSTFRSSFNVPEMVFMMTGNQSSQLSYDIVHFAILHDCGHEN